MNAEEEERILESVRLPWILFNVSYESGQCLDCIRHMKDPMLQDMALIEYFYFTGKYELVVSKAVKYLYHEELKTRLGAWLLYVFGHIALGNTKKAKDGVEQLKGMMEQKAGIACEKNALIHFCAVRRMLHLPDKSDSWSYSELTDFSDESGRLILCFLMEQEAKQNGEFERVIGVTDAILLLSNKKYPILFLHLYLIAASACLNLKDMKRGETYFLKAWELIRADGFYGALIQHCGSLQVFLEKNVRKQEPEAYKNITEMLHRYLKSREGIMNGSRGGVFLGFLWKLTGMEYTVALLAARQWSNQEIADYLEISLRTVKYHMSSVFNKLGVDGRKELEEIMPV